jgi:hypothetical protein
MIEWPENLTPKNSIIRLTNSRKSGGPALDGREQFVFSDAGYWLISYTFIIRTTEQILAMRALLARAAAGENFTLKVFDRQREYLRGGPATALLTADADMGDTSLSMDYALLPAGSHFSIGGYLYRVTSVETGGEVNILPPLRKDYTTGDVVRLNAMTVPATLIDDSDLTLEDLKRGTITLTFREAEIETAGASTQIELWIITGQSNAVGKGVNKVGSDYHPMPADWADAEWSRVKILSLGGGFETYQPGVNSRGLEDGTGTAGVWGPEAQAIYEWLVANPGDLLYIVKTAQGGSGSSAWNGANSSASGIELTDDALDTARAHFELANLTVAYTFHIHDQGETDADPNGGSWAGTFDDYLGNLVTKSFASVDSGGWGTNRMAIARTADHYNYDFADEVRDDQHSVANTHAQAANIGLYNTDDAEYEDHFHRNHTGLIKMGTRVLAIRNGSGGVKAETSSHDAFQDPNKGPFWITPAPPPTLNPLGIQGNGTGTPPSGSSISTNTVDVVGQEAWLCQDGREFAWQGALEWVVEYREQHDSFWRPSTLTGGGVIGVSSTLQLNRGFSAARIVKAVRVYITKDSARPGSIVVGGNATGLGTAPTTTYINESGIVWGVNPALDVNEDFFVLTFVAASAPPSLRYHRVSFTNFDDAGVLAANGFQCLAIEWLCQTSVNPS